MGKLIDRVKELKEKYLNEGLSEDEVIKRISVDLSIPFVFANVLYNLAD